MSFTTDDGFLTVENVSEDFFKRSAKDVAQTILAAFSSARGYKFPTKQYHLYAKSTTVRTVCLCNEYRLKCSIENYNEASKSIEVQISKKKTEECSCPPRLNQLRGEERTIVKGQLRVEDVYEVDAKMTQEVVDGERKLEVFFNTCIIQYFSVLYNFYSRTSRISGRYRMGRRK